MNILFNTSTGRKGFASLIFVLFIITWTCNALAIEYMSTDKKNAVLTQKQILNNEYQDNIDFIQSEIDKFNGDFKWLKAQIQKMVMFNQFVPEKMYKSLAFKQSKIQVLSKLKLKFENLMKENKAKEFQKTNTIIQTGSNPACNVEAVKKKIKQFGLEDWLELTEIPGTKGVRIANRLPILFASASSEIAEGYKTFLKNFSSAMQGCHARIFVDGYADIDPIHTSKYPSNFELGAIRAASVVHELIKNGLNPSIFKIGSTGKYRFPEQKSSEWKTLERHADIRVEFQ